jgi:hypothetical protein
MSANLHTMLMSFNSLANYLTGDLPRVRRDPGRPGSLPEMERLMQTMPLMIGGASQMAAEADVTGRR